LIDLRGDGFAEKIYRELQDKGVEGLFDDRDTGAGEKLSTADLLGIPYRLVIGNKTGDKIELKRRTEEGTVLVGLNEL
jgi:prolyl-tRNA synthetase